MITLSNRPYLFVDATLIHTHDGTELRLHSPTRQNIALKLDAPWEGPLSAYHTVVKAEEGFFLYYRGQAAGDHKATDFTCVAQSSDGIEWERKPLWKYQFAGASNNNIIWDKTHFISHNMAPFCDDNPDAKPEQRFKALGGLTEDGLFALSSPDGINWSLMQDSPIMVDGEFDSLNTGFWDAENGCYAAYSRKSSDGFSKWSIRSISRAVSDDFIHWSKQEMLNFGDVPLEHFYTNAIRPYERDPGLYLGFPKRLVVGRKRVFSHAEDGVSDAVFIASRDGINFPRVFTEAFVRPGLDQRNWTDRNLMFAPGMIRTSASEYSLYWSEHYRHDDHYLRRGTIRVDGFASLRAGRPGGTMTSVPVKFSGSRLVLNMSTSAAGTLKVGVVEEGGRAIPGYGLESCDELYGDDIERTATWSGSEDISKLQNRAVQLQIFVEGIPIVRSTLNPGLHTLTNSLWGLDFNSQLLPCTPLTLPYFFVTLHVRLTTL